MHLILLAVATIVAAVTLARVTHSCDHVINDESTVSAAVTQVSGVAVVVAAAANPKYQAQVKLACVTVLRCSICYCAVVSVPCCCVPTPSMLVAGSAIVVRPFHGQSVACVVYVLSVALGGSAFLCSVVRIRHRAELRRGCKAAAQPALLTRLRPFPCVLGAICLLSDSSFRCWRGAYGHVAAERQVLQRRT